MQQNDDDDDVDDTFQLKRLLELKGLGTGGWGVMLHTKRDAVNNTVSHFISPIKSIHPFFPLLLIMIFFFTEIG